jgi:hydrogenase expression/formation protein HypD
MIRVPGGRSSLEKARGDGAEVVAVFSAIDAVQLARDNPAKTVVFAAVGFETTAPATASAILQAEQEGLGNFLVLTAHKFVLPAMKALLEGGQINVDGFLCPGHVSVILGWKAYEPIVRGYNQPCAVAGFEPIQILSAIAAILEMHVAGRAEVINAYQGIVSADGNAHALQLLDKVFELADAPWRGLGVIPLSGMAIRPAYRRFDATERFGPVEKTNSDPPGCRCGDVVKGLMDPPACPLFGRVCNIYHPVGPCMVSSEGACAAWFKYGPYTAAHKRTQASNPK